MLLAVILGVVSCERSFKVVGDEFYMDGKPFRYIAGSFHYFRQQPEAWESTIRKMAAGGLNAVQTYVAWNLHEPHKGEYNFEGMADIKRFISLCKKYNMYVILRPGPYICAEWDFGGLPYWLLKEDGIEFRRSNDVFLKHCDDWLTVLYGKLKEDMYHNGGNIIMVQIENEYGSYSHKDVPYLRHFCDLAKLLLGYETFLFTTDGTTTTLLDKGVIPDYAYTTVDFGTGTSSDIQKAFKNQKSYNGKGPYVNSEFYPGWLDHWGTAHQTVESSKVCDNLREMLSMGASVNFYMYIGGTNFEFFNGANGGKTLLKNEYMPDPTSYDYDAPLSEAGDMTQKWADIRDVIKEFRSDIPEYEVSNSTKRSYGQITFTQGVSLWDALDEIATNSVSGTTDPVNMEMFDIPYGFAVYRTQTTAGKLNMPEVHDRAYVYVNRQRAGIVQHTKETKVNIGEGTLEILVENQGRLNYGTAFVEYKGLPSGAKLDGTKLKGWENIGFDLKKIGNVTFTDEIPTGVPAFYKGTFYVDEVADTFLNPSGWIKGVAIVNGYNIGRYWTIGPQLTLYVPAALLKQGENELIIFEIEKTDAIGQMSFDDTPQISIDVKPLI